jgi:DNA-binding PadR family transcriptional regulator
MPISHSKFANPDSYRNPRLSKQIRKILADDIAVRLLYMAHEGFLAKNFAYKSMGITRKQYYSRLKPLIKLQFIEKVASSDTGRRNKSMYVATTLGKMIFRTQVRMIEELSENIENVNLIERIKTDYQHIGNDKIAKISTILLDNTSVLRDVFASMGNKHDLDVLSDYETAISTSCDLISKAKSRVLVASRYVHPDAVKEMVRAASYNNIEVRSIIEQSILAKRIADLKVDSEEKLNANAQLLFPAITSGVKYRYSEVYYTFLVVDNLVSIIEVLSPFDQQFLLALKFNSRAISERLGAIFESMWKRSMMPYESAASYLSSSSHAPSSIIKRN